MERTHTTEGFHARDYTMQPGGVKTAIFPPAFYRVTFLRSNKDMPDLNVTLVTARGRERGQT